MARASSPSLAARTASTRSSQRLGPVVGADVAEWERMIAVNQTGLLYVTHAALPHLLTAAEDELRGVADIVNISSIAGRQAWANFGVYAMTKFGVNGFTPSWSPTKTSRSKPTSPRPAQRTSPSRFSPRTSDSITYMVTRPRRSSVGELWAMPSSQA